MIGKNTSRACATAGFLATALLTAAGPAHAQDAGSTPLCSSFNNGNVVYFDGSTAVQPQLQTLAKAFATALINIGIVYQSVGSCQGNLDLLTPTPEKATAIYLNPDGKTTATCALTDPVNGQAPDIAVADVFPATCTAYVSAPTVAAPYKEFVGPIQVMNFVTLKDSTENSISQDAAYTIFGFYGQSPYQVMPWTDPAQMFIRKPTSGVISMIGSAIGLPPSKWLATYTKLANQQFSSSGVLSAVQSASSPNAAIGILASDLADKFRNPPAAADAGAPPRAIKGLAYKHKGQSCGYLPDSDSTHYDKINVRQGRYAIWGPVHLITKVDSSGVPTNTSVATILQYLSAMGPSPDSSLTVAQKQLMIDAAADAFTIPWCAMQVKRDTEIGTPAPFQPPEPCGCYYESHKASMVSSCKACMADSDCSGTTPKCRYGFCEAQ